MAINKGQMSEILEKSIETISEEEGVLKRQEEMRKQLIELVGDKFGQDVTKFENKTVKESHEFLSDLDKEILMLQAKLNALYSQRQLLVQVVNLNPYMPNQMQQFQQGGFIDPQSTKPAKFNILG